MIEIDGVTRTFGTTTVLRRVSLSVDAGEVLVLLGPSGCGKTTLLRLIAGLDRPDGGRIAIGGATVAGNGAWVPPEKRQVGMVFQDWALFPHLTVGQNVAFGLKGRADLEARVPEMLDMVGLAPLADRLPSTLSGGQQQRVALARSLAPSPRVLLLDEPFSNLDAGLRTQLRGELRALLRSLGITAVFVTHDREEALELGDRLAVFRDGTIAQVADPVTVYAAPTSPWVARLVGDANLVAATADGHLAPSMLGALHITQPHDGPVEVLLRPESLTMEANATGPGVVELVRFRGNETLYEVRVGEAVLLVREAGAPVFVVGDQVDLTASAEPATAWPRE